MKLEVEAQYVPPNAPLLGDGSYHDEPGVLSIYFDKNVWGASGR
jgi:hypothetical protein